VRAAITDGYYGVFYTDTLDVTPALSVNLAGRFNSAQIGIKDLTGTSLTGAHAYTRFNPAAGLTYKLLPNVTLYGGYSESNRAPTPAELTCSDPSAPCSLANFFTGDPNLKQVVAHTFEVGVRGQFVPYGGARADWNLNFYRTNLSDDITFAQSPILSGLRRGRAVHQRAVVRMDQLLLYKRDIPEQLCPFEPEQPCGRRKWQYHCAAWQPIARDSHQHDQIRGTVQRDRQLGGRRVRYCHHRPIPVWR
jgi:outer membrane receptor protein involved in Fe transport